jgi:hypothetical protein
MKKAIIENVPKKTYGERCNPADPNKGYPDHYQMRLNRLYRLKQTKGKCEICGGLAKVVHHVDKTKDNHNISNLLAVCNSCHRYLHSKGATVEWIRNKKHLECVNLSDRSRYVREYGMSIKDMMSKLGMSRASIRAHLQNQKRRKGLLLRLGI